MESQRESQKEMPYITLLREPDVVPQELISSCRDAHEAVLLCIQLRRVKYVQGELADILGLSRGYWSKILNRQATFPINRTEDLELLCGNWAITQFWNHSRGFHVDMLQKRRRSSDYGGRRQPADDRRSA
jgi:hypothetical protein